MSKRNRYKFRNKEAARQDVPAQTAVTNVNNSSPASSPAPASVSRGGDRSSGAFAQHAAEYRTIRNDMVRLVILNGIMLAAVVALYYANRSSGMVDHWFHAFVK